MPVFAQVGFGVKKDYVTLGDFTENSLTKPDMFGIYRYGSGRGQFEFGYKSKLMAENKSGVFITDYVGIEPGAGYVSYDGNADYSWEPAIAIGPSTKIGKLVIFAAPRFGIVYAKKGNDNLNGGVISINLDKLRGTYWYNDYFNASNREHTLDFVYDMRYNVQMIKNDKQETYFLGYKMGEL